jgi:hypothetical protein
MEEVFVNTAAAYQITRCLIPKDGNLKAPKTGIAIRD